MGLNEFAGYVAVAIMAFMTGWIASEYGLRPYPFYLGIALVLLGFLFSVFLIKDTHAHVQLEEGITTTPRLNHVFWVTTW